MKKKKRIRNWWRCANLSRLSGELEKSCIRESICILSKPTPQTSRFLRMGNQKVGMVGNHEMKLGAKQEMMLGLTCENHQFVQFQNFEYNK